MGGCQTSIVASHEPSWVSGTYGHAYIALGQPRGHESSLHTHLRRIPITASHQDRHESGLVEFSRGSGASICTSTECMMAGPADGDATEVGFPLDRRSSSSTAHRWSKDLPTELPPGWKGRADGEKPLATPGDVEVGTGRLSWSSFRPDKGVEKRCKAVAAGLGVDAGAATP